MSFLIDLRKLSLIILLVELLSCEIGMACGRIAHINNYASPGDDVTEVLQKLINRYRTVVIDEGVWLLSGEIQLRSNVTIKGVDPDKSVLKRNDAFPIISGMLFYTEKANPDSYVNHDDWDEFKADRVRYENISFEKLTIDFNRSPQEYSEREIKFTNLYGIALIRARKCSVKNCRFVDLMTKERNNGYPAIVVYQSERIIIENNSNECVRLLQVIFSEDVTAKDCHCISSVGTAIEFIGGRNHKCVDNYIYDVWWDVSCIGVNSKDCVVKGNTVNCRQGNISCLTLGHIPTITSADNTLVEKNIFYSSSCRSIIIQNGCGIVLRDNVCSCIINKDSPFMTSGSIVASGNYDGIHDIVIVNNKLSSIGDGNNGCVTYRGSGRLLIKDNLITATKGVNIISVEKCDVTIEGNTINSSDYSIVSNAPQLTVLNNVLTDGLFVGAVSLVIKDNHIIHSTHCSYLGKKWESVRIEDNVLINATGEALQHVLLLNGSQKTKSFDTEKIVVKGNKVEGNAVKNVIAVSEAVSAPQLMKIKNND